MKKKLNKTKQNNKKTLNLPKTVLAQPKIKSTHLSTQSKKQNTLDYFNCLIDQVASPANKGKITKLTNFCRCNKGKVAVAKTEHKRELLNELAKNYQEFGKSLGHYLQADLMGCVKDLKK